MLLLAFWIGITSAQATVVDRVVAIVNQEIITLSELERISVKMEHPLFEQFSIHPPRSPRRQELQETLRLLIEKKLQLQAARQKGITVAQDELQQAINEVKIQQRIADDSALQQILSKGNLTLSDYAQEIREQLMILKLINREIRSRIVLPEGEISAYYDSHPEQFLRPEKIRLAQILLAVPQEATRDEIRDLFGKIQEIQSMLRQGADFSEIAKKYSDGPEAKLGGDLGYFRRGELMEEIEPTVFSLNVGQISDSIRTPLGLHIFKLLERRVQEPLPYAEIKNQLEEQIFFERTEAAYQLWLKRLRDEAYVEVRM